MSELNSKERPAHYPQVVRDQKYWLSLEHYNQDPDFLKLASEEFQDSPLQSKDGEEGWARRDFLKLMGASLALSTAGCIRRPVQKIVPYNKQPEEVTLGMPNFYTSTYQEGAEVYGLLVKTREGRPIKIEGNPSHPLNKGALSARAQASILGLYDPERLKSPKKNIFSEKRSNRDSISISWEDLDKAISEQLKKGQVSVLTGQIASPSTRSVVSEFCLAFKAQHVVWEALGHGEIAQGQKLSYGEALIPQFKLDQARHIVSIGADFLGSWLAPVTFTRQFSEGRKNFSEMNRLVVFDTHFTLTGANADYRYKIKPSQQVLVAMGLLHELVVAQGKSSFANQTSLKEVLQSYSGVSGELGLEPGTFKKIANELWEHRGKSLVLAGGLETQTEEAQALQVAVNLLNTVLENEGKTVVGRASGFSGSGAEGLFNLIGEMKAGQVKTLIIHRSNPIYDSPWGQEFREASKKVEMVIYSGDRIDETGDIAHLVLPDNHPMESWGDSEGVQSPGVFSLQQPTIRPLFDTRSFQLSLMSWAFFNNVGPKRLITYETFYDYLRNFWKEEVFPKHGGGKSFEDFWYEALQNGFVGTSAGSSARSFKTEAFSLLKPKASARSGYELVLYPSIALGDGRMSNMSWLQELPDPVTKIVWDNYMSVSLSTAQKNSWIEGSLVEFTVGGKKLTLPVHIQAGLHNDVMSVAVGYGRTRSGKVGDGVGQNVYPWMEYKSGFLVSSGLAVEVKSLKKKYLLACTQGHHSMEGRQIVVETTLKEFKEGKNGIHKHHIWNLWPGHAYNGHKWALGVDLNSCTGCSACMIACQSENNISVVGKKFVLQGREMHWIRIDRYYSGTPESPETVFQPVMCQHCDNAPCETVCPVLATVHSSEGLNEMVYNRCVGTRYCSNNCPYKVRRFNWFNYAKVVEKPNSLLLNPEVTPRMRGVMEKCTFCVQRIKSAKQVARLEERPLRDGEIKTACQVACPTDALVFGDMNDPESRVSKMFKDDRAYALLEEWHAAPAVRYLTKIRNKDEETSGASHKGGHA